MSLRHHEKYSVDYQQRWKLKTEMPMYSICMVLNFGNFRLLLQHGSDVEHKDHRGATLLFTAAENGSYKCLQQILCCNPDLFITVKSSPRSQV